MNDKQIYNVNDFYRYHAGLMSSAERHALEKAALDDPFLADALDGYEFTQTPEEDIIELRKRFTPEEKKARVIWFPGFLRIAATLILITGFGIIIFKKDPDRNKQVLAARDAAIENVSNDLAGIAPYKAPDTIKDISSPRRNKYSGIDSTELAVNAPINPKSSAVYQEGLIETDMQQDIKEPEVIREEKQVQDLAKEEVTNINNGTFSSSAEQRYGNIDRSAVLAGKSKKFSRAKETAPPPQLIDQNLSAPVSDRISFMNVIPLSRNQSSETSPADSLRTSAQLNTIPLKGEVKLSFKVHPDGTATDIQVVRSLCISCDAEGIKYVQSQRWKLTDPSKIGEVVIRF